VTRLILKRAATSDPSGGKRINAQMSGFGGEAEILCSTRALPVLTPSRHDTRRNPAVQRSGAPVPALRANPLRGSFSRRDSNGYIQTRDQD
jgi:hypothetical protein